MLGALEHLPDRRSVDPVALVGIVVLAEHEHAACLADIAVADEVEHVPRLFALTSDRLLQSGQRGRLEPLQYDTTVFDEEVEGITDPRELFVGVDLLLVERRRGDDEHAQRPVDAWRVTGLAVRGTHDRQPRLEQEESLVEEERLPRDHTTVERSAGLEAQAQRPPRLVRLHSLHGQRLERGLGEEGGEDLSAERPRHMLPVVHRGSPLGWSEVTGPSGGQRAEEPDDRGVVGERSEAMAGDRVGTVVNEDDVVEPVAAVLDPDAQTDRVVSHRRRRSPRQLPEPASVASPISSCGVADLEGQRHVLGPDQAARRVALVGVAGTEPLVGQERRAVHADAVADDAPDQVRARPHQRADGGHRAGDHGRWRRGDGECDKRA